MANRRRNVSARTRRVRGALAAAIVGLIAVVLPAPSATAYSAAGSVSGSAIASAVQVTKPDTADPAVTTDFASIFATDQPELAGAGWGICPTPVTWSLDAGTLDPAQTKTVIAGLTWAFDQWTAASGLRFAFTGVTTYRYDDEAFTLTRTDGAATPQHHIDIAFVADSQTDRMGGQTVGLGAPSRVLAEAHEIINGVAVFRTDHAQAAEPTEARGLYLHELGHVLGLAHAEQPVNVMYPLISGGSGLGAGDAAGIRAFAKPCIAA